MIDHRRARLPIAAALLGFVAAAPAPAAQRDERPNIVLILCDDMGFSDIGCYGGEIETPRLDRLASQGLRFLNFYNNAKCTQTRAALLTGLYHMQTNNLRQDNYVTLAEVLRAAGYTTLMAGKWHVGNWKRETATPTERGFERYFGFLAGAIDFWTGLDHGSGRNYMRLGTEEYRAPDGFYATDAFTDYAIRFVNEATHKDKPFFLYLAYNAPHFPLQAPAETIERYRGRYAMGWDDLRRRRYRRMIEMGIVDKNWGLCPRDPIAPAWDSLTEEQQAEEQLLMAVYAAMITRMDGQIGRLVDHLEQRGELDDTLILFLSDNGGCPFDQGKTPHLPPGPPESSRSYDTEWAQASNTPFRLYKQWSHEGGISTPMIVHWPGVVKPGCMAKAPAHLIDIMPTLVELAGATYPKAYDGRDVLPMEGRSLMPILRGQDDWQRGPMYWEYRGSRAVRDGRWKLVAERGKDWELYDIVSDRSELQNLIGQHPEQAKRLAGLYEAWAKRVGARSNERATKMPVNKQDRYLYEAEKKAKGKK